MDFASGYRPGWETIQNVNVLNLINLFFFKIPGLEGQIWGFAPQKPKTTFKR